MMDRELDSVLSLHCLVFKPLVDFLTVDLF